MIKIIRYNVLEYVNKPKTDWKALGLEINRLGVKVAKAGFTYELSIKALLKLQ